MVKYNSVDELPEEVKNAIEPYFTSLIDQTYGIKGLPPQLAAALQARTCRTEADSRLTLANEFLDEDLNLLDEKGARMMDRVINKIGHASPGEFASVQIGVQRASQILIKAVEGPRIGGSPMEKSTRYVPLNVRDSDGRWPYFRPPEIMERHGGEFESFGDFCFEVYSEAFPLAERFFMEVLPRDSFSIEVQREGGAVRLLEDELENKAQKTKFALAYEDTIKCAACDLVRGPLPAATFGNVVISENGRHATNLYSQLLTSPLEELVQRGEEMNAVANESIASLVKKVRVLDEHQIRDEKLLAIADNLFAGMDVGGGWVTLIDPKDRFTEIISYALFPHSRIPLQGIVDTVEPLDLNQKENILDIYDGGRPSYHYTSGRALEAGYQIILEIVCPFSEHRDLQRHRMMTQQRQLLTTKLGFVIPPEIEQLGLTDEFGEVAQRADAFYDKLIDDGLVYPAQYVTTFGNRTRFYMGMNDRQFQTMAELRTQSGNHARNRSTMLEAVRLVTGRDPFAAGYLKFVDSSDPDNMIARATEQAKTAGRDLRDGFE